MMGNPVYQAIMGQNPMINQLGMIMQAMRNPAQFVQQQIPDIPNDIRNNPYQILQYLQQTRGVTPQQIQQAQRMAGQITGAGTVQ